MIRGFFFIFLEAYFAWENVIWSAMSRSCVLSYARLSVVDLFENFCDFFFGHCLS